ncbi:FtsK/SpoIIIE domain-containing protein [Malikia spinosa]|uniref:FtsK/SpoIIIE domain-containing protein n=1 Tax=Malikia spinosa TaxID=86180 RepID=UPI000AF739D6
MNMKAAVISEVLLEVIARAFRLDPHVKQKCFRVKNFQDDEIVELVSAWQRSAAGLGLRDARLVAANDLGGRIAREFVADPGLSITYYRNHNESGLVYLENRAQSDEQGLQNLFTFRDSNCLDGSFDRYAGMEGGIPALIVRRAWEAASGRDELAPSLLTERCLQILRLVHPLVKSISVRHFVRFCLEVCRTWWTSPDAVDPRRADELVGACLWQLDLFPDEIWRNGVADARVRRRLELNAGHADLVVGGTEVDADRLSETIGDVVFKGPDGQALPPPEQQRIARLCESYLRHPQEDVRQQIPYAMFEQLFRRDTAGLQLGDRIRTEIQNAAGGRIAELDDSDLVTGLNERLREDAERFLDLEPPEGLLPLASLLSTRTRKALEQLASPSMARFFNPAIEIMRIFQRHRAQDAMRGGSITLTVLESEEPADASTGLFAFLFGPLLESLAEQLSEGPDACELRVTGDLARQRPVPPLQAGREAVEEEPGEPRWEVPLPIRFTVHSGQGELLENLDRLWSPPGGAGRFLALFWLLACAEDSPLWDRAGELTLADTHDATTWHLPFVMRAVSLDEFRQGGVTLPADSSPLISRFLDLRASLRSELRVKGLAVEAINEYLDGWTALQRLVRTDFVPAGNRPAVLDAFLHADLISLSGSRRRLMVPTHALRLRWIARYLSESGNLARALLSGQAGFSVDGGDQYLEWLETRSPHESPPTASGCAGEIILAKSEFGWFEDFAPLDRITTDVSVDSHALESIGRKLQSYLEAHPYKTDGLSLLIVQPPSDNMPAELMRLVERKAVAGLQVRLTVMAARERWSRISQHVDELPGDDRERAGGRFFPARDLTFLEFTDGGDMAAQLEDRLFDVALVTHVLQERVVRQENTEPPLPMGGEFNPLLDRPLRLVSEDDGSAISIVMRPRYPDELLETWGTLVVRAERSRPVSPTQPENTDFVELRINFQDSARIFNALHLASHWVITLERHISREQIESLEAGSPDVLSIESGIGANGLNTLIVSSSAGRPLIESRIARKLRRIAGPLGMHNDVIADLARNVYEETKAASPHLALKAMGVARVTEEIVGMCIARRMADSEFPPRLGNGLCAWISLDEHTDWFGGPSEVRADMCRLLIDQLDTGEVVIDVLVLEGKLRQAYDSYGVGQVAKTCRFFQSVLKGASTSGSQSVDAPLWRDRLLSAIENVAPVVRSVVIRGDAPGLSEGLPPEIAPAIRRGEFTVRSVEGLYSCCLWDSELEEVVREQADGILVVRSGRRHVLDLIGRPPAAIGRATAVETASAAGSMPSDIPATSDESTLTSADDSRPQAAAPSPPAESEGTSRGHMDEHTLRRRYEEILACFAIHSVDVSAAPADARPYIEGPASVLFRVKAGTGVDPRKLFDKSQALKLTLALEQDQNISFQIDRGFVTIDVPKATHERYFVDAAEMWRRWNRPAAELCVPLGEDRFGEIVSINFSSSNSPHLLVAGTTGSGKSEALNAILFGLARFYAPGELRLLLIDPKGTEMLPFENSAHLEGDIGWEDRDALAILEKAVVEMQRRYEIFRSAGRRSLAEYNAGLSPGAARLPWWLIVLDEYADLTSDPQAKKEIEANLRRLAQKARAAGIHVVIATQKPSADVISTNLRSNLPAQLALRVKSQIESRVILDETGAETLNGKGDGLLKAESRLNRVQCALVCKEDQEQCILGAAGRA